MNNPEPEISLIVEDKQLGMTGFVVVESTERGPGKGGIRMTPGVTLEEVARLAHVMTWKNSLFELPFGGAKGGIVWPGGDDELKEKFVRSFARKISDIVPSKYIPGPDVSSGEREMMWIADELKNWGASTGKPADYCEAGTKNCGLPHELGSTGFGVAVSTITTAKMIGLNPSETTVGIHGFGNVGTFAAKHLIEAGYKIVLLAGSRFALHNKGGVSLEEIENVIKRKKKLDDLPGEKLPSEEFWKVPVDILIPASVTNVINDSNKHQIKCQLMVQGGNIPMTDEIEHELHEKGIAIVPDFVANGGGIISSYAELQRMKPGGMFELVEEKITTATTRVMKESLGSKENPRKIAINIAKNTS